MSLDEIDKVDNNLKREIESEDENQLINGFEIDQKNNLAKKIIQSASGNQFVMIVPLKGQEDIAVYLNSFSEGLGKRLADLAISMNLGNFKSPVPYRVSGLYLNMDLESGRVKSLTKSYNEKQSKKIEDPYYHYQVKSECYTKEAEILLDKEAGELQGEELDKIQTKLDKVAAKITAFTEISKLLIAEGKQKDKEWSMFDQDAHIEIKEKKKHFGLKRKKEPNVAPMLEIAPKDKLEKEEASPAVQETSEKVEEDKPWYTQAGDYLANLFKIN